MARKSKKPKSTGRDAPAEISAPGGERTHLSIEKISNGYLVNRHGHRDGEYFDEKIYTAKKPVVSIDRLEKKLTGKRI